MKLRYYLPALLLLASASAFSAAVRNKEEATKIAIAAIHTYHLTALNDECGVVTAREKPSYFDIEVRERHTPECGGTPETGPRLFTLRVRKQDGAVTSDVYDGATYRPVDHKLRKH